MKNVDESVVIAMQWIDLIGRRVNDIRDVNTQIHINNSNNIQLLCGDFMVTPFTNNNNDDVYSLEK